MPGSSPGMTELNVGVRVTAAPSYFIASAGSMNFFTTKLL
jgi:hypothetical protein